MSTYHTVDIDLKDFELDLIESIKYQAIELGCQGIEEFNIDEARVDEILGERSYSGGDVPEAVIQEVEDLLFNESKKYTLYFEKPEDLEKVLLSLKEEFSLSENIINIEKNETQDWNTEWRKHFKTIDVSERLKIVPSWEKESDKPNELYIYPGMGFGTGSHETTYLCLKLMLEIELENIQNCLDFGCGSGILGLALLKFKKANIDLLDIDQEALDNSIQNININNFQDDSIRLLLSSDKSRLFSNYELIFANILNNVLEAEYETLLNVSKENTFLIISGLLNHQVVDIVDYYKGFNEIKRLSKGDWSAVLLKRV